MGQTCTAPIVLSHDDVAELRDVATPRLTLNWLQAGWLSDPEAVLRVPRRWFKPRVRSGTGSSRSGAAWSPKPRGRATRGVRCDPIRPARARRTRLLRAERLLLGTDALGGLLFGVVALATLGVSILRRPHCDAASPRLLAVIALACSIGAILMVTLTPEPGAENELQLVPFIHLGGSASETTRDVFGNIAGNTLSASPSELHSASWVSGSARPSSPQVGWLRSWRPRSCSSPAARPRSTICCSTRSAHCWAIPGGRMAAVSPAVGGTNGF